MTDDVAELHSDRLTARLMPNRGTNGGFSLVVDGVTQSHVNPDDPRDLQLEYVRLVVAAIDGIHQEGVPVSVLHLGGGALTVPRYVAATRPGSDQHVVELFGELYEFVVQHLPLAHNGFTAQFDDARAALPTLEGRRFDVAIVDVFSGDVAPWHISTVEFFRELREVLHPTGMVIVNTLATRGLDFTREAAATLSEVYSDVAAIGSPLVVSGDRVGNIAVIAGDHDLDLAGIRARLDHEPRRIDIIAGAELDALVADAAVRRDAAAR